MEWLILLIQTFLFLFLSFLVFTIPGFFLLDWRLKSDNKWSNFAVSTIVGFVFFSLVSYFLAVIGLHIILLILFLIIDFIYLKKEPLPHIKFKSTQFLISLVILFFIGVVGQLLVISPSGSIINGNIVFWSAHGHDGVWHLALVNELQKKFPFQNPDFASQRLVNYHFFSDLSIADFNYFFNFSSLDLYFRFFPLLFSILLGVTSFQLGKIVGKTRQAGLWAMVFTFFAGGFGYLVTLVRNHNIGGENLFWTSQVQSSSGNPPQIIAFVIVLATLLLLTEFINKPSKRLGLGLVLLTGTLAEFKIYGAIILLGALALVSIWYLVKTEKPYLLIVFLISSALAAVLYFPNSSSSESLLLFEPWWFIRTMVVAPDKLNWLDLELRRQTYMAHHSYLRVLQLEGEVFLIFLFGNLGMRFLGFWALLQSGKSFFKDYLSQILILMLLISLILPMLFIQKGIPANTIQFFQYFLLIFGILAGVSTAELLAKIHQRSFQVVLGIIIIILAVPTQIGLLRIFYERPPFAQISQTEIKSLHYLAENSNPNDVILTPPFQKGIEFHGPTPPIWIWSDTSYVPAFSGRRAFVTDTEQLDIMGYNYLPHQKIQKQIFSTTDPDEFEKLLTTNQIKFVYFPKFQRPAVNLTKTNLQSILNNDEVEIWKMVNEKN